jgi:hypothetical protein
VASAPTFEEQRHSPADRAQLLKELERQYARWRAESPRAYELTVSRLCFCDPGTPWVSRTDGVDVTSSRGGHYRDGRNIGPPLRRVEQLFAEAERAARSNADEVDVVFDERFGYPSRIRIDNWRGAADDELEWIAELVVLR